MGRNIMSMSDGEVVDLLYDKLNKTVEDCKLQCVYLDTPHYTRKPTGMEGQVDGKLELARELLKIIEDSQEVEYIWFVTDGQGNNMGNFVLESSAREYALKYDYSVGWQIKDRE